MHWQNHGVMDIVTGLAHTDVLGHASPRGTTYTCCFKAAKASTAATQYRLFHRNFRNLNTTASSVT